MTNHTVQTMSYANNLTITTRLISCDSITNITETIQNLFDYYRNNQSNPVFNQFANVTIIDSNCNATTNKYFTQLITLTKLASIRIQITFAAIYQELIYANSYVFNGFHVQTDVDRFFNLSSITFNNIPYSDACSSAAIAQYPLCLQNSTTPVCIITSNNPWNFNCSEYVSISTISSTNNTEFLLSTTTTTSPPGYSLEPWQIGLACGLGVAFLFMIIFLIGYFLRRHFRSKRLTFSKENLFNDVKLTSQVCQHAPTIIQSKQIMTPKTPWIHSNGNINRKPSTVMNLRILINQTKIHSNLPKKTIYIPNNHSTNVMPKVYQSTAIPRPVSGTSTNQLRLIIDGLEESVLDQSDRISLDPSSSTSPKKPSTPLSRQFTNTSFFDESLHDEDAWMSILAVANAELAVLNQLENEQNHLRTLM